METKEKNRGNLGSVWMLEGLFGVVFAFGKERHETNENVLP